MASILNDDININPTLKEAHIPVTVAIMASEAYKYLYTANWPEPIHWELFNITKHPTIKEFQKCVPSIESYLRNRISELHIDTPRNDLEALVKTLFKDAHISSGSDQNGIYYFCSGRNELILIVAITYLGARKLDYICRYGTSIHL